MKTYRIDRTGEIPLAFTGELVGQADGQWAAGREQSRWHDLRLYHTAGGQYVLHAEYHTLWQGELGHSWAAIAEPGEFTDVLASYDAAARVQSLFDRPPDARHRAAVQGDVVRRYRAQVTDVLIDVTVLHEKIK